jgi:DNA polymerase-3 subunit alpha
MYFSEEDGGRTFVEKAIKYVQNKKNDAESAQASLFGEGSAEELPPPKMPDITPWPSIIALKKEKEINGMYLSSHPLDDYRAEIKYFCTAELNRLNNVESVIGREVMVAGIVTDAQHRISKMGKGWGIFRMEDFTGDYEFRLFGEDYLKFKHYFENEQLLYVKARGRKYNQRQGEGFVERMSVDVADVSLLADVLEKGSKSLDVQLALDKLDTKLVDELHDILKMYPGKKRVKLHVIDTEEELDVKLPVKDFKVAIDKGLLKDLEMHPYLMPKINS